MRNVRLKPPISMIGARQIKALLCGLLLYVRAPGNMYIFYYDLDGRNDYVTTRILIFEGITLFSILYAPLIFIHRYFMDIGFFTYTLLVLVSMAVYGIGFHEHIRRLTKWQHDHVVWFPDFMIRSGYRRFIFGSAFFLLQGIFFFLVHLAYISTRSKYAF
jgi:hypothetical protein